MCDCKSCIETDNTDLFPRYRWLEYDDNGNIISEPLPPKPARPFADWPKGDGIRRHGKDKAYAAHWGFCGAEAHQKRAKLDMSTHYPPQKAGTSESDKWRPSPVPAPVKFKHTGLNCDGWRERMTTLNSNSIKEQ